ncbi:MAG: peptidoglycan editing factor PgeF [Firmicutes bacterium]|nr:peptidoglycan editing factor PgeF [Bacillota bacterium]MDD7603169.1 peptidoglycan editing factor PgeF [Bacillota bacterium]MDY5856594.1 peptidoglycan editing factor PgeF [Anaerovoracaceae bacterium]
MNPYHLHQNGETCWVTFPQLEVYPELAHLFTTRRGGVSTGTLESWNFGKCPQEPAENILRNYEILAEVLETDTAHMVRSNQTHTVNILEADRQHLGMGIIRERSYEDIDGLVTDQPGITLITTHGDCNPLFFYDPVRHVIGLAHSGWRGTLGEIAGEMIRKMQERWGCEPSDILAGIGPGLCRDCFEIDEDVAQQFFEKHSIWRNLCRMEERAGLRKYYLDLKAVIRWTLLESGVESGHIFDMHLCTRCHPEWFFSYRGQKGKNGNMAAAMMLRP